MGLFWFTHIVHHCREVKASGIWRIWSHYIDNQKVEKPSMLAVAPVPFSNYTMQYASQGMVPLPVGWSSLLSQDIPLQVFLEATVSSDSEFCSVSDYHYHRESLGGWGNCSAFFLSTIREHIGKVPTLNQKGGFLPDTKLAAPWCCTFQLPELWAMQFCCLYSIVLCCSSPNRSIQISPHFIDRKN